MQVILLEKVANLGTLGDLVEVKSGYARNYLFPRKKAVLTSAENLADFEQRKAEFEAMMLKKQRALQRFKKRLKELFEFRCRSWKYALVAWK